MNPDRLLEWYADYMASAAAYRATVAALIAEISKPAEAVA